MSNFSEGLKCFWIFAMVPNPCEYCTFLVHKHNRNM